MGALPVFIPVEKHLFAQMHRLSTKRWKAAAVSMRIPAIAGSRVFFIDIYVIPVSL